MTTRNTRCPSLLLAAAGVFLAMAFGTQAKGPPGVGDTVPDFELNTPTGQPVKLSTLTESGQVVLLVLRGWPGYQCSICTRQVRDYLSAAEDFRKAEARVVLVYPGPSEDLQAHAKEFQKPFEWPENFVYLYDPDYAMVNAYDLRWDAPRETAYPSTFVIDETLTIRFARVSDSHGGRTKAKDVLAKLRQPETP